MRYFFVWLARALALAGAALPGMAQGVYYVPLPTTSVRLLPAPCYVARVVDARPQRAGLGLVMRAGAPRLATFQAGLVPTLHAFYTLYVPRRPGAVPLVMRLTGLELTEQAAGLGEAAAAGLVADFYAPQADSSYRLVAHFAQQHARAGFDATGQHAANLGYLLVEAAQQAVDSAAWLVAGPRHPRAAVQGAQPLPGEALPIVAAAGQLRPGFYHTLPEFWENQPSEAGPPDVERHPYLTTEWRGDDEVKPYRRDQGGRRTPATDVWGFCDGENYYIRRGRSFYKLLPRGTGFAYYGELGDDAEFQRAASAKGAGAGLVGGLLLASATAPSGARRVLFTLDVLTGKCSLNQANGAAIVTASRPTHLFIYRPRSEKGPAVRVRLADDQPAQALAAGEFLTFEPASDAPLRVCLLPATGAPVYLALTPTAAAPTYLECRPTTPEPLRQVKDTAGAAALGRLLK